MSGLTHISKVLDEINHVAPRTALDDLDTLTKRPTPEPKRIVEEMAWEPGDEDYPEWGPEYELYREHGEDMVRVVDEELLTKRVEAVRAHRDR
jgi:hypothetical protein